MHLSEEGGEKRCCDTPIQPDYSGNLFEWIGVTGAKQCQTLGELRNSNSFVIGMRDTDAHPEASGGRACKMWCAATTHG